MFNSEHTPDTWVIIEMTPNGHDTFYKVLAGWYGGFTDGDSWRMNSGINKVEVDGDFYKFIGASGSVYKCHKDAERLSGMTGGIWSQLQEKFGDQVKLVDVDAVWEWNSDKENT
jgi:hypothetical protein